MIVIGNLNFCTQPLTYKNVSEEVKAKFENYLFHAKKSLKETKKKKNQIEKKKKQKKKKTGCSQMACSIGSSGHES